MAIRKNTEDIMARTKAVTDLTDKLDNMLPEVESVAEAGRDLLNQIGDTVEFEYGVSTDPNRNKVNMRRLVITGPWEVDPDKHGAAGQQGRTTE